MKTSTLQPSWNEADYIAYLEHERHMFAWCLVQYGNATPSEAMAFAESRYPYEPAAAPYRGLIFHDEAWHWAMLRIVGEGYWKLRPELQDTPPEYRTESQTFDETHNT